jgi:thiol-disulfide isomerase/thioredoxin
VFALGSVLVVGVFVLATRPVASAPGVAGLWDAVVVANKVEVPFRFEIAQNGSQVEGFFFEGDRRVGSTSGSLENGVLKLDYDFLNTTLEATLDGDQLRGTYRNKRPNARPQEFRAQRFTPVQVPAANVPKLAGNWAMYRTAQDKSKLNVSWRLYLRQSGAEISGAILKTSGDTGTLVGHWKDGRLVMSHFAGERPLLFEAQLNPDGTLEVTLDRESKYLAARSTEARAKGIPEPPDLSRFTSVLDPSERFHFSGPDLDGKMVSDLDSRFRGKVVLLTIGGSWCPNCHDEAPFLVELYKEFHSQGLEVVGLFFENDPDLAVARPRVLSFIKRYGVEFPMLVPGTPDEVSSKLPQLVNFGVYPTTIFIGRDGRVRSVHAGFASAATGEEHERLEREERELVEQLLAENPQGSSHKAASALRRSVNHDS